MNSAKYPIFSIPSGLNAGFYSYYEGYRFHFNGKEKDDETYGDGNTLDFGARIYDSRLARWLSLDSYQKEYPSNSPYEFGLNSPIQNVDADGNYVERTVVKKDENGVVISPLKFWKRAAIIEVNLTIHNLKIYDGSSNGYSNEVMLNSATKLVEDLNTSYRNTTEPKRGQVVITKFKVEGEVEVVKDLTQIETSGRNQTSLIYIADQKVVNQFSHTKLGDNANGATPSGTNLIVLTPYSAHLSGKNSNYTVSHEMGHALGLDHKLGDVKNLMYPYANPLRGVSLSFRQSKQLATTAINLDYSKHLKNLQKNENK